MYEALIDADGAYFDALVASDSGALERLLSDDFIIVDVLAGELVPREVFLALISDGSLRFERISREPDSLVVRIHGDVGVVVGSTQLVMSFQGHRRQVASRYTHVFADGGSGLRLVAAQGTPRA
ncbi:nuclear transport factor 2 family protein [Micromonospora auratinigra]|uniref:DUF4440 domain-containing protein n=1 Tax=Micromonospora auratinigra TaxID=261654 RepID=A0A1A8Z4M0_9ACTN|nr:nuclear transport factor 2 family protein [Micromonospora auratinigra]SBT38801.1 protein of unknown function (DUF4440) [Micromonospora auratinigra]